MSDEDFADHCRHDPGALPVPCPVCHALPFARCFFTGARGGKRRQPHKARIDETLARAHALEHLFAGLVRKYGDNGSSVYLTPEALEGGYRMEITHDAAGVLVEILEP